MKAVHTSDFKAFCKRSGITLANGSERIDNELTYRQNLLRSIVIRFGEADRGEYLKQRLEIVLSQEDEWHLVRRHRGRTLPGVENAETDVVEFAANEMPVLSAFLMGRLAELRCVYDDLYVIGGSGKFILSWDHHMSDEGLSISISDIETASKILLALNQVGAELELYSSDK